MTKYPLKVVCAIGAGVLVCVSYFKALQPYESYQITVKERPEEQVAKLTKRERRFIEFASAEYAGQIYMTPGDFLASLLERNPKPCLRRRLLTNDELAYFHKIVPAVEKNTSMLFRKLSDSGILSFADYLFLLSILTRPESGFRIAFDMFDMDGNQRIDHDEFVAIRQILGRTLNDRKADEDTRKTLTRLTSKADCPKRPNEGFEVEKSIASTLQIHFFGVERTGTLQYSDFSRFMKNLQQEVLQIEFGRYSRGRNYISDDEFAHLLLSYTNLRPLQYGKYLQRIQSLSGRHTVTYEEFQAFCQVLHNLEDFVTAMRFFYSVKTAISKDEFAQAVRICSGLKVDAHIIDLVFALFDEDCNGFISFNEFLLIIKNKLRFRCDSHPDGVKAFKKCMRQEMRY
ncbi:calcium uptake protein 3, mitochondrial-like [Armigeres subalbatus]|uniref:calcium uptake protein 3, mitochondrial-like n=1 Tax=Armigeres subalbatus TaxID=124917 RepID=UPI002ED31C1E